ncbi:LamG-like jellyroll fold domain-containing protein [Streptomyces sp. NPDC006259]|uniref:LamG-like jellyroll fold domain-containing protein n=1 Tax=Streptomyces sp. NPDC006259 TaxID=3364740 RepID=UPI0036C1E157
MAPYSGCLANDCRAAGGPGVDVTFALAPNEGDANVVSYAYRLSSENTWRTVGGATARVTLTPQRSGLFFLEVRARDDVGRGRLGPGTQVSFMVAEGDAETGRWRFGEAAGAALDSGTSQGARHDAALSVVGATRDERGRRGRISLDTQGVPLPEPVTDRGLLLDGTEGYAATDGPVVKTGASYTVSAWVRPNALGSTDQVVLAQGGTDGFRLLYDGARGTWALRTATEGGPGQVTVAAGRPAVPGVWTHLAAMYDAAAGRLRLYVNGRFQAEESAVALVAADGPLEFGRAASTVSAGYAGYFGGSLDEVGVWQRPLTETEIADEARVVVNDGYNAVELVADWSATGRSGTTLGDTASGYAPELTLSGGAALDGRAIVLDGVDGAATANGPLVDDTGSFTVSTEVALDAAAISTRPVGYVGQILGRRSADGSVWGLWYQVTGMDTVLDPDTFEEVTVPVGAWRFGRRNADGTQVTVTSDQPARLDGPVRLTGVHDAQDGVIELYVGAVRNGDAEPFTATPGSGDFTVGAVTESGSSGEHLPARVMDVRVWAGAMASSQQVDAATGG